MTPNTREEVQRSKRPLRQYRIVLVIILVQITMSIAKIMWHGWKKYGPILGYKILQDSVSPSVDTDLLEVASTGILGDLCTR